MDIAEYFTEDELVLSKDPEPFDELPDADLLVITSGYLKAQDKPAFLEYAKTLSNSHVIILYKDFSDLESIVNVRDLDYDKLGEQRGIKTVRCSVQIEIQEIQRVQGSDANHA